MFKQIPTKSYNWILIIGILLLVAEFVFSFGGTIIPAIICGFFVYVSWKSFDTLWGKIVFWLSLIGLIFSILSLMAVRFLIIAAIVIFAMRYYDSTKRTDRVYPKLPDADALKEPLSRVEPLFNHTAFDDQFTEETAYQWKDVNIHGLFGDKVIDLSNTVIPDDTAIISIRHGLGNIEIYVPYEVEVSIHHSAVFGNALIFHESHEKLFNKSIFYQTAGYDTATTRVKVVTSLFSGDIEVKRI
ncbi:cell wall-active antibiotics response protein LiaF [Oceanobacillus alkalisoli]|uniref:cell wall-active antibiotics response protein LiaF n=1 Tax=Oceanobacillus alkalisoli TaxID=2925113 RepID=UPI001EEFF50F|nr:cell wall-active antibiotics response protein LiaF [Oceanobacillus alkalisoli]MCF3943215.1 cell wall-active antibiotics response protein LiaF [Oceanobacillus alkalisoli]MCG5103907.1 cell wall-active antibiotics response protein LiaF [Oceanobacillus alkalisoli]